MEPLAMLSADPLDLLFENRNKSYGAYPLRKYYARRLIISMGFTFTVVVLSTLAYIFLHSRPLIDMRLINIPGDVIFDIPPTSPVKPVTPAPRLFIPKPPAAFQLVTPLIVKNQPVPEPMATIEELTRAEIGLKTIQGIAGEEGQESDGPVSSGSGGQMIDSVEKAPAVYDITEVMPEYAGGTEALKRFLIKNLRMPENNLEPGAQVHVVARFIVGADGKVRDIEITIPADEVFNAEVKRVILKMPDWKPGIQNHRKVAVYFNLPVNFVNRE